MDIFGLWIFFGAVVGLRVACMVGVRTERHTKVVSGLVLCEGVAEQLLPCIVVIKRRLRLRLNKLIIPAVYIPCLLPFLRLCFYIPTGV